MRSPRHLNLSLRLCDGIALNAAARPVSDSDEGEKKDEGDVDNDVEVDMGVDVVESASSERSPSPPLSRHVRLF